MRCQYRELHKLLATWKLSGSAKLVGRQPGADDLVLPWFDEAKAEWTIRNKIWGWREQRQDLQTLGLRHRRQHDFRRTFISLARTDGAKTDVLKLITHGAPNSQIMDVYTTFTWETLCEQVATLKVNLKVKDGWGTRIRRIESAAHGP